MNKTDILPGQIVRHINTLYRIAYIYPGTNNVILQPMEFPFTFVTIIPRQINLLSIASINECKELFSKLLTI